MNVINSTDDILNFLNKKVNSELKIIHLKCEGCSNLGLVLN